MSGTMDIIDNPETYSIKEYKIDIEYDDNYEYVFYQRLKKCKNAKAGDIVRLVFKIKNNRAIFKDIKEYPGKKWEFSRDDIRDRGKKLEAEVMYVGNEITCEYIIDVELDGVEYTVCGNNSSCVIRNGVVGTPNPPPKVIIE